MTFSKQATYERKCHDLGCWGSEPKSDRCLIDCDGSFTNTRGELRDSPQKQNTYRSKRIVWAKYQVNYLGVTTHLTFNQHAASPKPDRENKATYFDRRGIEWCKQIFFWGSSKFYFELLTKGFGNLLAAEVSNKPTLQLK